MERELDRLPGEDKVSEKYTKIYGVPTRYTIVASRYIVSPDGKLVMVWDKKLVK